MIKRLFFLTAVVAPGLAYGADPSADLSAQIVPAGKTTSTQCPATPPAEAQRAGFTAMALCQDFTQPIPNTAGTGLTANWNNCGTGSPGYGSWYGPCGHQNQITDPQNSSSLVMDWNYTLNQGCCSINIWSTGQSNVGPHSTWPQAGLYEVTYADNMASANDCNGHLNSDLFLQSNEGVPGVATNEHDIIENWSTGSGCQDPIIGAAVHNWGTGNRLANYVWNYPGVGDMSSLTDIVQNNLIHYHTFGLLITTNGSDTMWDCGYVDHVQIGCVKFPYDNTADNFGNENWSGCPTVNYSGCWGQKSRFIVYAAGGSDIDFHEYVKSIKVWTCPAWNAGPTDPTVANIGVNTCYTTGSQLISGP